jgi:predicted extracellular nuclease
VFARLPVVLFLAAAWPASAQLSYVGGTITQDFDTLPAAGTLTLTETGAVALTAAPISAVGTAGWSIAPTSASVVPKFRVDSGNSSTASHLSCGGVAQTDRALGMLASGSYLGRAGLILVNNTGALLTEFTLTFTGEQWRNGGSNAANTLTFAYAVNAASISTGSYTTVPALNFTSQVTADSSAALDGNAEANRSIITATVTNVPWAPGETLVLRWSDADDSGSDDALAIDDVSFSAAQGSVAVITRIHAIQGTGVTSPLNGTALTVEAVVTGDFQGAAPALGGFYLQERAADADADPISSEGIFVSDSGSSYDVAVGDAIRVSGTVSEVSGVTTITAPTFIAKVGTATPLAAIAITLPPATTSGLERYEGMLVQISQPLTVVRTTALGSSGQLTLSSAGVIETPTESIDPNDSPASGTSITGTSNVAAISAQESLITRLQIVLDDASTDTNPNPTPYLNAQQTRRCGDTISSLTGFISYASGVNKLQPVGSVIFADTNPRPATAPNVGGRIKVAGMNALNFFLTLGSRGATSAAELQRQQDKLIAEIIGLDADIVGFMEIENTGTTALDTLVTAVNTALGGDVYVRVPEPASTGSDLIRVAMMYRPAVVTPGPVSFTDGDGVWNRQPLAVVFTENSTDAKFIACVNHFKSKSSTDAVGADLDQNDGQGPYNDRRKQQAARLATFLTSLRNSTGTDNVLIFGDLNAYSQEDPIDALRASGFADQTAVHAPGSYSYSFDGTRGHLDHALATAQLATQVTGVANWHINADEPSFLDYTLLYKTAAQQALNIGTPFRASDHDPVLIGLALTPPTVSYSTWAAGIPWPIGADATPTGDADHDGLKNLEELLYNANPLVADFQLGTTATIGADAWHFGYRLRHTASGYNVVPQSSTNLTQWTDLTGGSVIDTLSPTTDLRSISVGISAQPTFFRLDIR